MKTHFAILWIDDNAEWVEALKAPLQEWMDEQGFTLNVHYYRGEAGVIADLAKNEIELIIIDYHLGDKNGDEIIKEIRQQHAYQDIVFYSTGGTHKVQFSVNPDGVFFVDKQDAERRIQDLLLLKIRRASDLATLRGWIVADSIELEEMLGGILSKCFKGNEELFANRVLAHEGLFDFGKKHMVLNGIIKDRLTSLHTNDPKSDMIVRLRAAKQILDQFATEIIGVRNSLAHQFAEISETGAPVIKSKSKGGQPITFTPEKCVEIRNNIRKHHRNLVELEELV